MANLMQQIAEELGHCCIYSMLEKHKGVAADNLADRLGVSDRTVANWRRKKACGECKCKHLPTCEYRESTDRGPRTSG